MAKEVKAKRIVLLILLTFIYSITSMPVILAAEQPDISEYSGLILNLSIKGEVQLSSSGKLSANLSLFPQNDNMQTVLSLEKLAVPTANIQQKESSIFYSWDSVSNAQFGLTSRIQTNVPALSSKTIPFPPQITENSEYTKATENIDVNDEITKKANEIVAGKTDTLKAITALADFVYQNIVYDEAYKETIKKSSWVLQNKKGVCDEFTNLFVALCRSLGIPARYISGVAYSNVKNEFGNHAWAEVYLPEYGWIPFDATYGQYGFVDASHISLAKSSDVQSSIVYSYLEGTEITAKDVAINTTVFSKLEKFEPKTTIELRLLKDMVKYGAYAPLEIKIKNNQDYYLPFSLYLVKSLGLYGKNSKNMILAPNEEKTVFFIIEVSGEDIEPGYMYKSQIEVRGIYNDVAETTLTFSRDYEEGFSLEEAKDIVDALTKEEKEERYNVDLNCNATKSEFYEDEEARAKCEIANKGNVPLENLELCIKENCRQFDLEIGKQRTEEFTLGKEEDYIVSAKNSLVDKSAYLGIKILKKPDLKIIDIKQKELDYSENKINLTLETKSMCKNLVVNVNNLKFIMNETNLKEDIPIMFAGKNALSEKIKVKAKCYDLRNRLYEDEKTFEIKVNNVPFYAKIWQFFVKLFS